MRVSVRSVAVRPSGVRGERSVGVAYSKTPPTSDDNKTLTTAGKGNGGTVPYTHMLLCIDMLLYIDTQHYIISGYTHMLLCIDMLLYIDTHHYIISGRGAGQCSISCQQPLSQSLYQEIHIRYIPTQKHLYYT